MNAIFSTEIVRVQGAVKCDFCGKIVAGHIWLNKTLHDLKVIAHLNWTLTHIKKIADSDLYTIGKVICDPCAAGEGIDFAALEAAVEYEFDNLNL